MLDYRWFLVGPDERTYSRREYKARDDAEAVEFARELYSIYTECNRGGYVVELWQKHRLVLSESHLEEVSASGSMIDPRAA